MDDSSAPATKGDLAALATKADLTFATKTDLQKLEQNLKNEMNVKFQKIDNQFKNAREDSDRILDVLVNIDKRLSGTVKDHEKRITILEEVMAA